MHGGCSCFRLKTASQYNFLIRLHALMDLACRTAFRSLAAVFLFSLFLSSLVSEFGTACIYPIGCSILARHIFYYLDHQSLHDELATTGLVSYSQTTFSISLNLLPSGFSSPAPRSSLRTPLLISSHLASPPSLQHTSIITAMIAACKHVSSRRTCISPASLYCLVHADCERVRAENQPIINIIIIIAILEHTT